MHQMKTPACGGRLHADLEVWSVLGGTLGIFPSNTRDFRTADADIGELAVAKTGQFPQAGVVGTPLPEEAEETGEKHDHHPFDWTEEVRNESGKNIGRDGAVQKILCCGAAMQGTHIPGHN